MKRILIILSAILSLLTPHAYSAPAGDWKVYPTFNDWHQKVIETPNRVYIQSLAQPVIGGNENYAPSYNQLFVYDKEADEMLALSTRNWLSSMQIEFIAYNPVKKYLMVVYNDANIDMLYDNGERINIPDVANASINRSKVASSITFDNDNNLAYISTGFGYVVINDRTHKVASSLQTSFPLLGAGRIGEKIIILSEQGAYQAPYKTQGLTEAHFTEIDGVGASSHLIPLTDSSFAFIGTPTGPNHTTLCVVNLDESGTATKSLRDWATYKSITQVTDGYFIDSEQAAYLLSRDGSTRKLPLPPGITSEAKFTTNMRDYWVAEGRKGLRSFRLDNDSWTVTRNHIRPNAPSTFICEDIIWTEKYGAVAASHGTSRLFGSQALFPTPMATMRNGNWNDYSLAVINPDRNYNMRDAVGLENDPINPDVFIRSSRHDGLTFINFADPKDYIQITTDTYPSSGGNGFYPGLATFPNYVDYTGLSAPTFDSDGTLWVARHRYDLDPNFTTTDLFYWTAADRKTRNFQGFKKFSISSGNTDYPLMIKGLKAGANKNLLIYNGNDKKSNFVIVDHNGTPGNTSDDKTVIMDSELKDQDGSKVNYTFIYDMYEDPQTGLVWVANGNGLFTINPRNAFSDNSRVNRIKVARNDGTNLADYLFNGISVTGITSDRQGRKWFGTIGGGLVCTSSDGREILYQLTTENSYIPDNNVYGLCYIPDTNSILISTGQGMAEYFPAGSSSGEDFDSVKVYPNPVRPDYLGWITIDGLIEGSIVKITDASGGLVRELGPAEGGVVQWDATNMNFKRVGSGVYYVLASTSGEGNMAKVAKILVVR